MSEKTKRTLIRCRYWLAAFVLGCATLTIGTYINARYSAFTVSLNDDGTIPNKEAPTVPAPRHDLEKEWERGGNI